MEKPCAVNKICVPFASCYSQPSPRTCGKPHDNRLKCVLLLANTIENFTKSITKIFKKISIRKITQLNENKGVFYHISAYSIF